MGMVMRTLKLNEISNLHICGRTAGINKNGSLSLFWAGSGLELYVKTREVWVDIESSYDTSEVWLCTWINGRKISRFMAPMGKTSVCLCRNLNPDKENRILLMRDTQPMSGDQNQLLKINSVSVNDETEFLEVPEKKLKIEFVGDSITSGEGLAGNPSEMDWISQWISVSENYAVKTAFEVDADFNILSQCGWGVVSGWDNNATSVMPPNYTKICGLQNNPAQKAEGSQNEWDFSLFKPDYVFVNLGTNDAEAFNQPAWKDPATGIEYKMRRDENKAPLKEDGEKLSSAICNFLKLIREKNPSARICWLWGMISIGAVAEYIQKGVELYRKESGDGKIDTLILPSMENEKTDSDKGSRGHPGPLTHKLAVEKLVSYIKNFE